VLRGSGASSRISRRAPGPVELVQVAVEETAVPTPGPGEVLVRMAAAAVNPSDEGELRKAATGSMQYAV
jgi:NADPH:quinone reductase-like Zn-dependent oxidoreductase